MVHRMYQVCSELAKFSHIEKRISRFFRRMVAANFIVVQIHPIVERDRATVAIVVEVDKFGRSYEPGCQKLRNESDSGGGQHTV